MARRVLESDVIEFGQAVGLLLRKLRATSNSQDFSWTQTAVMSRLANEGPATTAELARAEGMKPQSMGTAIAALEEMGLVERTPDPTDGRQVHIALTQKGATLRKSTKDAKRTWLLEAINQLEEEEQQTLFAAGRIIHRLVEL